MNQHEEREDIRGTIWRLMGDGSKRWTIDTMVEELEKIFVPFRRLQAHEHIAGSGVGLYFTKNLVEQQGGSIWVESELGQGSRFFVRLIRL